jgi:hypothetical protein
MTHAQAAAAIYGVAVPFWFFVWWRIGGVRRLSSDPLMWLPFVLCPLFLIGNAALALIYGTVGDAQYEESRFVFIGERARLAIQASSAVLVVATIVYGLTLKRVPVDFTRFIILSFVMMLGLMAPILWIPTETPSLFFVLRHFQTVALLFGLFLCVGGIVILLDDLTSYGEIKVKDEDEAATDESR